MQLKIYNVGKEELTAGELEEVKLTLSIHEKIIFVYEYECVYDAPSGYGTPDTKIEGTGASLTKIDGLWYYHCLGHCSCGSPTKRYRGSIFGDKNLLKAMTLAQLKSSPAYLDTWYDRLGDLGKFRHLVDFIEKNNL